MKSESIQVHSSSDLKLGPSSGIMSPYRPYLPRLVGMACNVPDVELQQVSPEAFADDIFHSTRENKVRVDVRVLYQVVNKVNGAGETHGRGRERKMTRVSDLHGPELRCVAAFNN